MTSNALRFLRQLVPKRFHRARRLIPLLERSCGGRVLAGPFVGLVYADRSFGSAYWPKLLGTYELEIGPDLERMLAVPFRTVVVAGAAEGYYAVGLALRLPHARVVAWEANEEARAAGQVMASRNGVAARIEWRGICDAGGMREALGGEDPHLLVMDIEGGEAVLLDPELLPALRRSWILVEVHDCYLPGLTRLLEGRFGCSHESRFVAARARALADVRLLDLPSKYHGALVQLLSERRPEGNDWLALTPREAS